MDVISTIFFYYTPQLYGENHRTEVSILRGWGGRRRRFYMNENQHTRFFKHFQRVQHKYNIEVTSFGWIARRR